MPNVKKQKPAFKLHPHLLTVKANSSFIKTYKKIGDAKSADFVIVKKPIKNQMAAALLAKITGKKFLWVQGFTNPPTPDFLARLLLSQADRIIVSSKRDTEKLKNLGIAKDKIRYQR